LTGLERQRLIKALLSQRHLILSGPAGIGKYKLAYALALAITGGQESHVCLLQGHPWWAAKTGDVARFVEMQTRFSEWRLTDFIVNVSRNRQPSSQIQAEAETGDYVACVQGMSPVEIDFYFKAVARLLLKISQDKAGTVPIRLIGTYDSPVSPDLDHYLHGAVALVHLSGIPVESGEIP